jgi:hypothetical protein
VRRETIARHAASGDPEKAAIVPTGPMAIPARAPRSKVRNSPGLIEKKGGKINMDGKCSDSDNLPARRCRVHDIVAYEVAAKETTC